MDWRAAATLSATSVPHPNPPLKRVRQQSPSPVVPAKAGTQTNTPRKVISKLSAQRHGLDSRSFDCAQDRLRGNDKRLERITVAAC